MLLYGTAGVVGLLWALIVLSWSPAFLVPTGPGGFAVCAVFYLWPGFLIALLASRIPKVRTLRCSKCGWSEERQLSY